MGTRHICRGKSLDLQMLEAYNCSTLEVFVVFVVSMPLCLRWRPPILGQSTTFRRMAVRFASKFIQLFIILHHREMCVDSVDFLFILFCSCGSGRSLRDFARASQPGDRRLAAARWNLPKTCSSPGRRAGTDPPFLGIIGFNLMFCRHQSGGED